MSSKRNTIEINLSDGPHAVALARKRIKRINLRVSATGELSLSAPLYVSTAEIEAFLENRRCWLEKALERQRQRAQNAPEPDEIRPGGRIRVCGRFVPILAVEAKKASAEYSAEGLKIGVYELSNEAFEAAVDKWRRRAAKNYLAALTAEMLPRFERYNIPPPSISVKKMKTRWGSCSTKKAHVNYNIKLLSLPPACARYVVAHELAHFAEASHGRRFYEILKEVMPDYKERERLLKKESCSL
ncbi:MAG: SprT family zinc-dependent metalloprotease [Oscillospiraceae bacterium]|nr:SprT family zinc-dependent metalloprotease [Oscillospiraceae bacterium]